MFDVNADADTDADADADHADADTDADADYDADADVYCYRRHCSQPMSSGCVASMAVSGSKTMKVLACGRGNVVVVDRVGVVVFLVVAGEFV